MVWLVLVPVLLQWRVAGWWRYGAVLLLTTILMS